VDTVSALADTSIALDGNGYPHISYYDVQNDDLKYAYKTPGGWVVETVDSAGVVGEYSSLALEATAPYTPHIGYYDGTNYNPKYAYKGASGWYSETVDTTYPDGQYTSIALDSDGYPHISHYDWMWFKDLKYSYKDAGGWHTVTVDDSLAGEYAAITLDGDDNPHISYQATDGRTDINWLKYAHYQTARPYIYLPLLVRSHTP
jgi:hypothetical protein